MQKVKCLVVDDEAIARDILKDHLCKIDCVEIIGLCKNGEEALNALYKLPVDLIFLDINMPGISGLSVAKSVNRNIKIIFTTAYREYAVEGFDLQAVDYLLKPISFERLYQAINKYLNECEHKSLEKGQGSKVNEDYIFIRSDRKMVRVDINAILFIESLSDYIKIVTKEKSIVTRETISGINEKLSNKNFLRVHRSYIVAIAKISEFTNEYVLVNNKVIPISRSYKDSVLQKLEGISNGKA